MFVGTKNPTFSENSNDFDKKPVKKNFSFRICTGRNISNLFVATVTFRLHLTGTRALVFVLSTTLTKKAQHSF